MSRVVVLVLIAGLLVPTAADAAAQTKYSGRIAAARGGAVTLDEIGPWKPGSRPVARVIELSPSTRVERVARNPTAAQWPGGFEATPLAAHDLHPGEFATVTAERHGKTLIAVSITVVATP